MLTRHTKAYSSYCSVLAENGVFTLS